jgi:hypothetical protein
MLQFLHAIPLPVLSSPYDARFSVYPLTTGPEPVHIYGLDAVYYSILIHMEVIRDKFNSL